MLLIINYLLKALNNFLKLGGQKLLAPQTCVLETECNLITGDEALLA